MTIVQDPCSTMASLGIAQMGDPQLTRVARRLTLPTERARAEQVEEALLLAAERVQLHHPFANGLGVAANQLGYAEAVAVVRPREGGYLTFFNPRIIERSVEHDEQYEGCLSFFDVRGLVPRPLRIVVAHTGIDGVALKSEFTAGLARLVGHELDHLEGRLYTAHLRTPVMPVEEYRQIRRDWDYGGN
ncbi:peptide deformylase [Longispora sp. NPDC051575]|uniref:peptide deformylase n=1 Tax=Longispora sp. NPDC051575 TaxID=3154943 RepID=UPI00342219F2